MNEFTSNSEPNSAAKDWLEAALKRCELQATNETRSLGYAGYELLTTLVERQLKLGQSAILDSVASMEPIRQQWRELAKRQSRPSLFKVSGS